MLMAVPCGADDAPPACRPAQPYIVYTGTTTGCSVLGGTDCELGEIITFQAMSFGSQPCPFQLYQWDFGDGAVSTSRTVHHAFPRAGVYVVRLTIVTPLYGTATAETTVNVAPIIDPPPAIVHEPLMLDGQRVARGRRFFTYTTPGPWTWHFGDGTSVRTSTNPQDHIYAKAGVYVVTQLHESTGERFHARVEIEQTRARAVRH